MFNNEIELNDNELIYLYKECKNRNAYKLLEEKYLNKLFAIGHKYYKYFSTFGYYSEEEIDTLIATYFLEACNRYKIDSKINFWAFVSVSVKNKFLDSCKNYSSQKHHVLNYSISIDEEKLSDYNLSFSNLNSNPEIITKGKISFEETMKWVNDYLEKNNKDMKDIFLKISSDESIKDICKENNWDEEKILNKYYYIRRKLREDYKKFLNDN